MRSPIIWLLLISSLSACFQDAPNAAHLYQFHSIAPSYASQQSAVMAMQYPGATMVDVGVNFSVYSENATRIDLLIWENPEADLPTQEYTLTQMGNVWNGYVEGLGVGTFYSYVAWGPNWVSDPNWIPGTLYGFKADVDDNGNRFNPNKLLYDPYCEALHRNFNWNEGTNATGPDRVSSDWAASSKCVIVAGTYQWSPNETTWQKNRQLADNPGHNANDLIIYETHVKGFTMDPSSGVMHPGTFRGVGENAAYLADLGITAVELMPVAQKPTDGTYWGYNSLTFFAPELTYAATPLPTEVLNEFEWMVDQLHQANIEVVLDVVYNHYGEGGLWENKIQYNDVNLGVTAADLSDLDPYQVASLYSWRGLDNAAYYALAPVADCDGCGYWDNTGVGEQSRPNNPPFAKQIIDSLHFWVQQTHVDGFRFDLAALLGDQDGPGNYNNWPGVSTTVLQTIIDDPLLNQYHVPVIAEPWQAGGNMPYAVGAFPAATDQTKYPGVRWYEWNGQFRDWWRPFLNCPGVVEAGNTWNQSQCGGGWALNASTGVISGGGALTGSASLYQWNGRPYHAVNFVTIHDGFTLYDLFSYSDPVNGCGPLNPTCCTDPSSVWCDTTSGTTDNRSKDWGGDDAGEASKRQMMRNTFAGLMLSQGTPLLLGGDEWMRTQLGNNNAYSNGADNNFNWYNWGEWAPLAENQRMHDFVRKLIAFRKSHEYALAPTDWGTGAPFVWMSQNGDTNVDWGGQVVMMYYNSAAAGPLLAILINGSQNTVNFALPADISWGRVLDTQSYFDTATYLQANAPDQTVSQNIDLTGATVVTGSYGVAAGSIVVLESPAGSK